jgi:hypothetical protein
MQAKRYAWNGKKNEEWWCYLPEVSDSWERL